MAIKMTGEKVGVRLQSGLKFGLGVGVGSGIDLILSRCNYLW